MSDNQSEAIILSNIVEQMTEEESDRRFFDSLRGASITKESIINMSSDRVNEIRLNSLNQFNQLNSTITDFKINCCRFKYNCIS